MSIFHLRRMKTIYRCKEQGSRGEQAGSRYSYRTGMLIFVLHLDPGPRNQDPVIEGS